ncbi:5'-nucleotidase, lipoprotein e(P4) family [Marininema halotolerans]|uniref:5'-nucleotidase, lipoprotein e(P4) family n=1 Tax=Marininema halotolerans TaxID=1155944 RepID=A0A1I6QNY5_9BACL|nr:5'-nucleotidase, lipoprotein e(P4) family [Marininema halotolerans]SFS54110.1 5'-nucleotidase, lipoprotein e(P4) family [Marininema halotolerans]
MQLFKWVMSPLCTILLLGSCLGCNTTANSNDTPQSNSKATPAVNQSDLMMATLWQQKAGEALALQYQAYNLAKERLTTLKKTTKKPAVILDIDETVLDNSPYQAYAIKKKASYPTGWDEWVNQAKAKTIAGAKEFLDYANQQKVDIYYLTNRSEQSRNATLSNLKKEHLPQAESSHLLLQGDTSDKQPRRDTVAKNHSIALLIGDNLGDFSDIYYKAPLAKRNEQVAKDKAKYGKEFIILPNPMYGDWEGAIYQYNYDLSTKEKEKTKIDALESFK